MTRNWLSSPQVAISGAALLTVAITVAYFISQQVPKGDEAALRPFSEIEAGDLDISPLDGLPEGLHDGALAILVAQEPEMPSVLEGIPASSGDQMVYPVNETIQETQPILRWMPFGTSYSITLLDANSMVINRAEGVQATEWKIPRVLSRGAVYTWQVSSGGQTESASFQILDNGAMNQWSAAKFPNGRAHLVLGIAAQELGMMSVAKTEFEALVRENPNSDMAARLLQNLTNLREH